MSSNFFAPTIPIPAVQARVNAVNNNAPTEQIILLALNALIVAQSNLGLYSLTYTVGALDQNIINQLISTGYTVVDTSVTNVPPTPVYNYLISWQQINEPAAGQPQ
jgi:hypothetical protein